MVCSTTVYSALTVFNVYFRVPPRPRQLQTSSRIQRASLSPPRAMNPSTPIRRPFLRRGVYARHVILLVNNLSVPLSSCSTCTSRLILSEKKCIILLLLVFGRRECFCDLYFSRATLKSLFLEEST